MQHKSRPEITDEVTQGVLRYCFDMGWAALTEVRLKNGRRADILALDKAGKFHCIEVKSSREDFQVDQKWQEYLEFCDTFSFAVQKDFPTELIPKEVGLLICDSYGWHQVRDPSEIRLHASRRKTLTLMFARTAAFRIASPISRTSGD